MPEGRAIAIGDVHGCLPALRALLAVVEPRPQDTIVTLGDYVDRGSQSRGVLDEMIALAERCRLIPLLGNHDEMLLEICRGSHELYNEWLLFGGHATVASYGRVPEDVPAEHLDFLKSCLLFHESREHFFVHGNYEADLPLQQQTREVLLWEPLRLRRPGPHCCGKTAIVGHTSQKEGEVLDLGYLKCIDTFCYGSGWLTAMEVETGRLWQADKAGRMREPLPGPRGQSHFRGERPSSK